MKSANTIPGSRYAASGRRNHERQPRLSREHAMKLRSLFRVALCVFLPLLTGSIATQAAEIKLLTSPGFGPVFREVGPAFERATGHQLATTSTGLGIIVKRVNSGEPFDVVMAPRSAIDGFVQDGKADAGSFTAVATAGMGVAVRAGSPIPDVSTPDALKRALLAAKSITYPDSKSPTGNAALGAHLERVFALLGIAGEMKSRTVFSHKVDVGELVANGEAEIAIGQLQSLARSRGIEIVGPLPHELQDAVVFAAAILTGARNTEAARALIDFMRTPEAAAALRAYRMEPVSAGAGGSR
jgi:molybdate transport system substrate-binding protein